MGEYQSLATTTAEELRLFSENMEGTDLHQIFGIPFGTSLIDDKDFDTNKETTKLRKRLDACMSAIYDFLNDRKVRQDNDYSYSDLDDENCIMLGDSGDQISQLCDVIDSNNIKLDIINRFWTKNKNKFGLGSFSIDMHEVVITRCPKTLNVDYSLNSSLIGGRLQIIFDSISKNNEMTLVEAEQKAQRKLMKILTEKQGASFIINDCFYEDGKSGVRYLFRRNRPILAFRIGKQIEEDKKELKFLAALCIHPMGYYSGTFAGVMAPSDELIANLNLLRADEHGFWKRSNQHPMHDPRSGV